MCQMTREAAAAISCPWKTRSTACWNLKQIEVNPTVLRTKLCDRTHFPELDSWQRDTIQREKKEGGGGESSEKSHYQNPVYVFLLAMKVSDTGSLSLFCTVHPSISFATYYRANLNQHLRTSFNEALIRSPFLLATTTISVRLKLYILAAAPLYLYLTSQLSHNPEF